MLTLFAVRNLYFSLFSRARMAQRVGAFFKRNWTLIAVGVPLGMGM